MIKIFAHRGFVSNKSPENSIAALDEAYNNKFDGVEFDLWFLENKIIIVHDKPNKKDILKKISHQILKKVNIFCVQVYLMSMIKI